MIRMRGNTYQLFRRVPKRYHGVETRRLILLSLHTDSKNVATDKANGIWKQMVEAWEARLAGDTADADRRLAAAKELAAVRGFRYLDAAKVAALPIADLVERIYAVPLVHGIPDRIEAAALLGGATDKDITISAALDLRCP